MILIVEDDRVQNEVLVNFLAHESIEAVSAFSLKDAVKLFSPAIRLIVLDLGLPDGSGFDFLKFVKEKSNIPVIVLTAQNDELTQLNAFGLFADEFIEKPFSPLVMTKRIKAWLKRLYPTEHVLKLKDYTINFANYTTQNATLQSIELTATEYKILKKLSENKNIVLTREALIEAIWGFEYVHDLRILDSHIKNIRKKLSHDLILTVKGVGYKLGD